jgi:acetyl esterase/lipase
MNPLKSWSWIGMLAAVALLCSLGEAFAYGVTVRRNIEYAAHDGVKLYGDLYHPVARERHPLPVVPVVIAIHGGGWESGTKDSYEHWGRYLAEAGFAVLAIDYRLTTAEHKTYPGAVYDVRAAVQFVRAHASTLAVEPDSIALMGDGAGAHLAALVSLANAEPQFSSQYKNDPDAGTAADVKAVAVFYGMYDLTAQWQHDQTARPLDQATEKFLGSAPMADRHLYFEASPLSYATTGKNKPDFLVIYGTSDEVVDAKQQSQPFEDALRQAQFFARKIEVPSAGHYWLSDPFSDPASPNAYVAPRLLRFLEKALQGSATPPS